MFSANNNRHQSWRCCFAGYYLTQISKDLAEQHGRRTGLRTALQFPPPRVLFLCISPPSCVKVNFSRKHVNKED